MAQTAILIPFASEVPSASPEALRYRAASRADATKRAIEKCWRAFQAWCQPLGYTPFPCKPDTLEAYLIYLALQGRKVATIEQYKYAINVRHRLSGLDAPGDSNVVKIAMAGIKRAHGVHQRQAAPLTIEHVRSLEFNEGLMGSRDRALLMTAVCTGLRASELMALHMEHLERTDNGYSLFIPRSKGDQEGEGAHVSLVKAKAPVEESVGLCCPPTRPGQAERDNSWPSRTGATHRCPVAALDAWLDGAEIRSGPVFLAFQRHGTLTARGIQTQTFNQIVKCAAARLGFDPWLYSAHSTRAGCATYLLEHGIALNIVAKHLRHKCADTTLRYDRSATMRALEGVY